uniref:Candidate secreted effector protein n=1 Tax=Bursaphelenchus xylophilus TaxID=6326 RepID=A0A1I7SG99_BURXY
MKFIFFCLIFPVATVFSIEKQGYNHSVNVAYDLVLPSRIIENCYGLNERPGVVLDAKDNAQIVENKQFKWLETEEPYDYNNIRPGVEIPDGPTFYVMAYEDTPDQKAGEWLPVDGNTEINAVLCNLFKAL